MSRILPTLRKRRSPLASGVAQQRALRMVPLSRSFEQALHSSGLYPLRSTAVDVLQLNIGRKCNQTCRHCHVDAGPDRKEMMSDRVMDRCLEIIEGGQVGTVDITGGAPELHPRWRELVTRSRTAGCRVIDRCNLTILLLPNYSDLPEFLADEGVEVVASLPHYRARQTDSQRGDGVFEDSIEALRRLNALGYGRDESGLVLNLVTNPVGSYLPGDQATLEREWKRQLDRLYGVTFNDLYVMTNLPVSRFLEFLETEGRTEEYLDRLVAAYNPAAAAGVMCRDTISVSWDGRVYDCDFNQMLELSPVSDSTQTIFDVDLSDLVDREIAVGPHCFGCTAGAGSSCGGATHVQ